MEDLTNDPADYVGIDISKERLDIRVSPAGETRTLTNDAEGIRWQRGSRR